MEREQIECVFCLGGGELHQPDPRFPDEWDGVFAYWYDGYPEYASSPSDDNDWYEQKDRTHEFRTAIVCEVYGQAATPEGWERVGEFSNSGERECWGRGAEMEEKLCPLCEVEIENSVHPDDGHVYIGEGWCEVVYCRPIEEA